MASSNVMLTPRAESDLRTLSKEDRARVVKSLNRLAATDAEGALSFPIAKLESTPEYYVLRANRMRVVFRFIDGGILVAGIYQRRK